MAVRWYDKANNILWEDRPGAKPTAAETLGAVGALMVVAVIAALGLLLVLAATALCWRVIVWGFGL